MSRRPRMRVKWFGTISIASLLLAFSFWYPMKSRLLTLLLLAMSVPASAGLSTRVALNYDNSVDTEFRDGSKPVSGGSCPTGWTCTVTGDATQDIDEVSGTSFLMVVSGSDEGSIGYAYKNTAADDDVEIIARVPAAWGGHSENDTQFGIMLLDNAAYRAHCYWREGSGTVKFKTDVDGAGESQQNGLANQARPRYIGLSYLTADTIGCFESTDGTAWIQVGTHVSKVLSFPVRAGVYGTSYDPIATSSATPTAIAFSNTPTIEVNGGGDPDPPPNVAPVWQSTPIITGTAGTASEIIIANAALTDDCTKRVCDDNGDALTLTAQGCTWPTGVTVNNTSDTVEISTAAVAGTTTNCKIGADDGTAARVDSSAFSIVIAAAGGGGGDATLTFESGFEGGAADISGSGGADWKKKTAGQGQQTVVTNSDGGQCPVRAGTYMARMEIPAGASGNPQRAELKSLPGEDFQWDGTRYWVGYSFCVESFSGTVNTLFQIHAPNADATQCFLGGNLVGNHSNGRIEIIDSADGIAEASGANSNHVTVYNLDLAQASNQDVWHDFVWTVKVNTDRSGNPASCNGDFTVWHQGEQKYSGTNLCNVTYKDACGTTIQPPKTNSSGLHIGLYQSTTTQRVMYYDATRVAEGANGYNTVDPAQDD